MYSRTVVDEWFDDVPVGGLPAPGVLRVVVDASLPHNRRLSLLEPVDSGGIVRLTPALAGVLGLTADSHIDAAEFTAAREAASIQLNGADHVFYFPLGEHAALTAMPASDEVRRLRPADADAFAAFEAAAPDDDLDEAFVELDHWLVYGRFVGDELVAAASMYPWSGTRLADLGVLTLPAYRGRGFGRETVRALSAEALRQGYEPQYRCQLDNHASVALAAAAGLQRFATWDVVAEDDEG